MYAIISCGGKQYKVVENEIINVEHLDLNAGEKIEFEPLLIGSGEGSIIGAPTVKGAVVSATVMEHGKGDKLNIAVYKKMGGHHRAQGHRQPYSQIRIDSIKK